MQFLFILPKKIQLKFTVHPCLANIDSLQMKLKFVKYLRVSSSVVLYYYNRTD